MVRGHEDTVLEKGLDVGHADKRGSGGREEDDWVGAGV